MSIALILNVCVPLIAGGEACDQYIVDTFPALIPCTVEMRKNRQTRDDRFLSCGDVDDRYLVDRRDGRNVAQILSDLNREL